MDKHEIRSNWIINGYWISSISSLPFTFIHKSQLQTQNSIYASYKLSECISFNEENEIWYDFFDGIKHICKKNIFLFNYQKGNLNIIKFSSNWIWAWKVTQTSLFVQQLLLSLKVRTTSNTISSFKLSFSFVHYSFFVFNAL